MKNFFDKLGKLGEILAPVTGSSNNFFSAIQHHDNVEVQSLLLNSADTDMSRANENGYSAIHCACRYNNMFAVDLIMSRGNHITPLTDQINSSNITDHRNDFTGIIQHLNSSFHILESLFVFNFRCRCGLP